jgi:Fic family protein
LEETESRLRRVGDFNHRQQALLLHALKNPNFRYTIQAHQRSHGVVYQTARSDLLSLAQAALLIESKPGKAFVFTPALDMAEKLREKQNS